jgi:hypothetical protein
MRYFKAYWTLGLSILTVAAAWLSFSNAWDQLIEYQVVFYYAPQSTVLLVCLIIPLCIFVTMRQLLRLERKSIPRRTMFSLVSSVLMLIGANMIACGALPRLVLNPYRNLSITYLGDHLYRLDTIHNGTWRDLDVLLLLWECDSSGWFCRIIYAQNYYADMVPKLTSEPQTNILSLIINDKVAYAHQP